MCWMRVFLRSFWDIERRMSRSSVFNFRSTGGRSGEILICFSVERDRFFAFEM